MKSLSFTKSCSSFFLLALWALILCSCGNQPDKDKVLRLGYLPITDCLPVYIAQEKGLFEKHGLKVSLTAANGGPEIFKELEAGAIDIGFSNVVSLIKQVNAGRAFQSVFGSTLESETHMTHAIVSRANETQPLGASRFSLNGLNSLEELMLLNYLKNKEVEINAHLETQFKVMPFPQMLAALKNKEIDYACIVEPWITIAAQDEKNFKVVENYYPTENSGKALVATYVAKKEMIIEKEAMIKQFIAAMEEATDFLIKEEATARELMLKYIKLPEDLVYQIQIPEFGLNMEEPEWNKVIEVIYNPEFNFNHIFLQKPENKIQLKDVRYEAQ